MILRTNTKIALLAGALLVMSGYDAEGARFPDYSWSVENEENIGSLVEGCGELWKIIKEKWQELIKMNGYGYDPLPELISKLQGIDPKLLTQEPTEIQELDFDCNMPEGLASYIKLWELPLHDRRSLFVVFRPCFIEVDVGRTWGSLTDYGGKHCFVVPDENNFFCADVVLNETVGDVHVDICGDSLLDLISIKKLREVMDEDFSRVNLEGEDLDLANQLRNDEDCVMALKRLRSITSDLGYNYGRLLAILTKLAEVGVRNKYGNQIYLENCLTRLRRQIREQTRGDVRESSENNRERELRS